MSAKNTTQCRSNTVTTRKVMERSTVVFSKLTHSLQSLALMSTRQHFSHRDEAMTLSREIQTDVAHAHIAMGGRAFSKILWHWQFEPDADACRECFGNDDAGL